MNTLVQKKTMSELQYTSWWDGSGMKFKMGGMDPTCQICSKCEAGEINVGFPPNYVYDHVSILGAK